MVCVMEIGVHRFTMRIGLLHVKRVHRFTMRIGLLCAVRDGCRHVCAFGSEVRDVATVISQDCIHAVTLLLVS